MLNMVRITPPRAPRRAAPWTSPNVRRCPPPSRARRAFPSKAVEALRLPTGPPPPPLRGLHARPQRRHQIGRLFRLLDLRRLHRLAPLLRPDDLAELVPIGVVEAAGLELPSGLLDQALRHVQLALRDLHAPG